MNVIPGRGACNRHSLAFIGNDRTRATNHRGAAEFGSQHLPTRVALYWHRCNGYRGPQESAITPNPIVLGVRATTDSRCECPTKSGGSVRRRSVRFCRGRRRLLGGRCRGVANAATELTHPRRADDEYDHTSSEGSDEKRDSDRNLSRHRKEFDAHRACVLGQEVDQRNAQNDSKDQGAPCPAGARGLESLPTCLLGGWGGRS